MLKVSNNHIFLTRGDTAALAVTVKFQDGSAYDMGQEDQLIFTVKAKTTDTDPLITKNAKAGTIVLQPEDTANLPYGNYVYDIELRGSGGFVYTIIPPALFRICEEVTF